MRYHMRLSLSGLLMILVALCILTGIETVALWRFDAYKQAEFKTQKTLFNCKFDWGDRIEISREVERRLQTVMPNPKRWIVIKTGSTLATYAFKFLGIDDEKGLLLQYQDWFPATIEKTYPLTEAQALFARLTQHDSGVIVGDNDLYGPYIACDFLNIEAAHLSIDIHFIGQVKTPEFAHNATAKTEHTGLRVFNRISAYFDQIAEQHFGHISLEARIDAANIGYTRDTTAGHTLADRLWQQKRAIKNTFFELPRF